MKTKTLLATLIATTNITIAQEAKIVIWYQPTNDTVFMDVIIPPVDEGHEWFLHTSTDCKLWYLEYQLLWLPGEYKTNHFYFNPDYRQFYTNKFWVVTSNSTPPHTISMSLNNNSSLQTVNNKFELLSTSYDFIGQQIIAIEAERELHKGDTNYPPLPPTILTPK